jgi:cell division protein FtsX
MNKLTVNRVALGSLRRRRGQYRSIIFGAGLAIFFISALFLTVQSLMETYRLEHIADVGTQDAILYDAEATSPEALLEGGWAAEVGNVFVLGETEDGACPIGCYDEVGLKMLNPTPYEGRLPARAGEIAVEPNFLQKLRSEAKVGDAVELTLKIPRGVRGEFLPDPVKATYRLVGILKPQSAYLAQGGYSDFDYLMFPSAIVSGDERVAPGGRAIVHRMVSYAPDVSARQFIDYADKEFNGIVKETSFSLFNWRVGTHVNEYSVAVVLFLGIVLALSACLGIVNAFSANLSQRRGQIGMMRAVGATGRQIRDIFGREALLLALIIAPLSIALSYLCVWGLTALIGSVSFYANPWFLPVDFALAFACVALAAWIPLVGASRVSPMQAIREVSLLRARRRIKVRSRREYGAPRLIAARHLSLYRTRQAGIAAVVAFSMLLISVALPALISCALWYYRPIAYGYQIRGYRDEGDVFVELRATPHDWMTDSDIAEMLSLPLVSGVDTATRARINLLADRVTPYAIHIIDNDIWWYDPEDRPLEASAEYASLKAQLNLHQEVLPALIVASDPSQLEAFAPYVLDGKIDIDALNAGREVLVVTPDTYYQYKVQYDDGSYTSTDFMPPKNWENVRVYENDIFFAGGALHIMRLSSRGELNYLDEEEYLPDFITGVRREDAETAIGAVIDISGASGGNALADLGAEMYGTTLLTTHAGLSALGIESSGYSNAGVRLSEAPDDEAHAYLSDALEGVAARGNDMRLDNNVQAVRDGKHMEAMLNVCLLAVLLLLLSMCVSLVNNAITNRVRSEKRAIGTLRAVGAQRGDIVRSYQLQALALIGTGVLTGLLLSGAYYLWLYLYAYFPEDTPFNMPFGRVALVEGAFLLAVALLCGVNLRVRIREITRDSIVSNIREL